MEALRVAAERIATEEPQTLHQEDVFFNTQTGRLKLRIFSEENGQLIQYQRPDSTEAKTSEYEILRTNEPTRMRRMLSRALGERVTVTKRRRVVITGQTRIHLDEVEGLGTFMELEVVMRADQSEDEGKRIAEGLMAELGIRSDDLVSCAYADLLQAMRGDG